MRDEWTDEDQAWGDFVEDVLARAEQLGWSERALRPREHLAVMSYIESEYEIGSRYENVAAKVAARW